MAALEVRSTPSVRLTGSPPAVVKLASSDSMIPRMVFLLAVLLLAVGILTTAIVLHDLSSLPERARQAFLAESKAAGSPAAIATEVTSLFWLAGAVGGAAVAEVVNRGQSWLETRRLAHGTPSLEDAAR